MVRDSRWDESVDPLRWNIWAIQGCKLLQTTSIHGGKFIYGLIHTGNIIASWNNIWQYIETNIFSENRLKPKRKLILQPSMSRCNMLVLGRGTGIKWIKIGVENHYASSNSWMECRHIYQNLWTSVWCRVLADYTDYVVDDSHSAMRIFSNLTLKQQLQTSMISLNEFLFTIGSGFYL